MSVTVVQLSEEQGQAWHVEEQQQEARACTIQLA